MAALTLRTLTRSGDTTKGSPLTNAEIDTNFINIDAELELKAPIASPSFSGVPIAPTAGAGTNTTQIATTQFVTNAIAANPVGSGTLTLTSSAGASNLAVGVSSGSGFTANTTSNYTYNIQVGPSLTNLAAIMTGGTLGFLKKTAADIYSLDGGVAAGSTTLATFVSYNGTTRTDGNFYGGTTNPTNVTRLNYDGNFHATNLFGTTQAATMNGTVGITNGGTGLSTLPGNGQLLIGNGTAYTLATLTAGSGISITNTAGQVTLSAALGRTYFYAQF